MADAGNLVPTVRSAGPGWFTLDYNASVNADESVFATLTFPSQGLDPKLPFRFVVTHLRCGLSSLVNDVDIPEYGATISLCDDDLNPFFYLDGPLRLVENSGCFATFLSPFLGYIMNPGKFRVRCAVPDIGSDTTRDFQAYVTVRAIGSA